MKLALGRDADRVQRRADELASAGAAARIWQRDATFWGGDVARQRSVSQRLGWLDVAEQMRAELPEIRTFAGDVAASGITDAVLLGMGGSSLAAEVLREGIAENRLASHHRGVRLHVLDTTDPRTIASVMDALDPARSLFIVSSKSGGTVEAMTLFEHFYAAVQATGVPHPGERFVAITDAGTSLERLARERAFRRVFLNPADIGGRYSALSFFGLVPAALAGVDVARLVDAGVAAEAEARAPASEALLLGALLGEMARAGRDKCTFLVAPQIAAFGLWLEQLIAESTGKDGRGILPVTGEPIGSPRHYGSDRLFVQVRLEADSNGENDAAIGALRAEGHPVAVIELDSPYDLGGEFFRWEFAVAVAGHVLGVNPFDEPNVQESKDNTARVLAEFEATGKLDTLVAGGSGEMVAVTGAAPDRPADVARALAELLESIPERGYFAITAYITPTAQADATLNEIRAFVRDAKGVATTLGYGPRFLHSTGQLHKGGPPLGVFLQVTADDVPDVPIPRRAYTFGQLKRAQALGDFQALTARGRPIVRLHLGADVEGGLARVRDMAGELLAPAPAEER